MTKVEFEQKLCQLLHISTVDSLIRNQVLKYVTELGYDYDTIYQALFFFIEVDKGKYDPKYGIGIVPYVKDRARAYFAKIEREKELLKRSVRKNTKPDIILKVEKPQERRKIQEIDIDKLDD